MIDAMIPTERGPIAILVVDDEPDMEPMVRQMLRTKVRRGRYVLAFAANGREALAHIDAGARVDVLVTDINMPQMTGLELLEVLATRNSDAKAIVVSAYGDMGNLRAAMNLGAFDFITKPVDFADLELTIERTYRYLESWRVGIARRCEEHMVAEEAQLSRAVQRAIVPSLPGWDSRLEVDAALSVRGAFTGDFVDVIRLEDERVGLLAARAVRGAGLSPIMSMMHARSIFKGAAIGERHISSMLARASEFLECNRDSPPRASALYAVYDPSAARVEYAALGDVTALVLSPDGSACVLPVPVGCGERLTAGLSYDVADCILAVGQTLVLCSSPVEPESRLDFTDCRARTLDSWIDQLSSGGLDLACVALHRLA